MEIRSLPAHDVEGVVAATAAAYLGATPLRSRGVQELRPGAVSPTSTAFGPVDGAPWSPMF